MLVVRAILGSSYLAVDKLPNGKNFSTLQRAPDRDNGQQHDSLTAEIKSRNTLALVHHPEYVLFKEQQALVQYLMYYRHAADCDCAQCQRRSP